MAPAAVGTYADIPGWFRWVDKTMVDAVLRVQAAGPPGDLVELGAYLGRSAVVLGGHLRPGERLVVVDLFGADPEELEEPRAVHEATRREQRRSYGTLTREAFEANYAAVHGRLPVVVQAPTRQLRRHVADGSARFVHVDAGHQWEDVRDDAANARAVLAPDGVVVFSDYRTEHTPAVAAVVWEAAARDGLQPFAVSGSRLYATFGDGSAYAAAIEQLARADPRYRCAVDEVRGAPLVRVSLAQEDKPAATPVRPASLEELERVAAEVVARVRGGRAGDG